MEREGGADHGAGWRPPFLTASLIVLLWSNHINYGASDRIAPAVVAPLQGTLVEMFKAAALTRAETNLPKVRHFQMIL